MSPQNDPIEYRRLRDGNLFVPGLIPEPIDRESLAFTNLVTTPLGDLPPIVNHRNLMPRVLHQGSSPTCVGYATRSARYAEAKRTFGFPYDTDLSAIDIYKQCKERDGIPNTSGTYLQTAGWVLRDTGCATDEDFPFDNEDLWKVETPYPPNLRRTGTYRCETYLLGYGVDYMKRLIYEYGPVAFGVDVIYNLVYPKPGGIVDYAETTPWGGHAMCAYGYDDSVGRFLVQNSWGSHGANGHLRISYEYIEKLGHGAMALVGTTRFMVKGDFDADTRIRIGDATLLLRYAITEEESKTPTMNALGDLNQDGTVNVADVQLLLKNVIGE